MAPSFSYGMSSHGTSSMIWVTMVQAVTPCVRGARRGAVGEGKRREGHMALRPAHRPPRATVHYDACSVPSNVPGRHVSTSRVVKQCSNRSNEPLKRLLCQRGIPWWEGERDRRESGSQHWWRTLDGMLRQPSERRCFAALSSQSSQCHRSRRR